MAADASSERLREEATCSVCLDFFAVPVTLECGHNFCRACITQCWREPPSADAAGCCPQCRERVQTTLRPNGQLASLVEVARQLCRPEAGRACAWHQEPLKLFCRHHDAPICVVCDKSKEHRGHDVVPVEEAALEYKHRMCHRQEILRKEREKILGYTADLERESQDLLKEVEAERQQTVAEFKQLHQFLEEQEKLLLAQMEAAEKEIARKRYEHMARLSTELSSLEKIIKEIEEKCQQPASELLQDVRSTLQRSEKEMFKNPVAFPPALKWRIWDFGDINSFLKGIVKQFKEMLGSGLPLQKANVTLDPDTAHPKLVLSEECQSVRVGDKPQDLPDSPERFDRLPFVLGREGFTSGRHFWEVTVGSEGEWFVGVARKSVRRKGTFECGPEEGVWVMGKSKGEYWAFTPPHHSHLSPSGHLRKVLVTLNCAGGRLAFFDAESGALLYMFSEAPFAGETTLPFFYLNRKAHLRLSSLDSCFSPGLLVFSADQDN